MAVENKDQRVSFRTTSGIAAKIEKEAEKEGKRISDFIHTLFKTRYTKSR